MILASLFLDYMLEAKTNLRSKDKPMAPNEKTSAVFQRVPVTLVWIAPSSFPGIKGNKTEIKASLPWSG